ncbi:hypothetical protein [Streptomyces sp. NPDC052107]|uniref:hypothetical protein n=1 Tax=Streptomyces sp. NPDC052107 TaxID=3155632 RepID=UPI00343F4D82
MAAVPLPASPGGIMTGAVHVCRHCDEVITDPEDAVLVWHEMSNSGPGWSVYAHRAHAHLVKPDPQLVAILTRIRATRARMNSRPQKGGEKSA